MAVRGGSTPARPSIVQCGPQTADSSLAAAADWTFAPTQPAHDATTCTQRRAGFARAIIFTRALPIFGLLSCLLLSVVSLVAGDDSSSSSTGESDSLSSTGTTDVDDDYVHVFYKWYYIVISFLVATVGSGTSLQVMKQRTGFYGYRNWLLLFGGSISLGAVGIWCMHFIGMMSLQLTDSNGNDLPMRFNPGITVASLVIAIVIITAGLALAGDPKTVKLWRTCIVGCIGGGGVAAMHYTGMMAMVCQAKITWDGGIIVASIIVGIVAATAALLIFFHLSHLWQDDMRLQLLTAVIMGIAVNAMHYTGMQAAHWHKSPIEPNLNGYATPTTLTGVIIALAVVTCLVLLGILFLRYRRLHSSEMRKMAKLTLSAVVRNSQGKLLTTLAGTLPSVVIESEYAGTGMFDRFNADFLRMLKISFSWPNVDRYARHLAKLHASGSVPTYSLDMFTKFVAAARSIAHVLNLPVEQLGFLYYSPTGNMVTLIVKSQQANGMFLENSGLRFVPPAQVKQSLSEFQLPPDVDPDDWLDMLKEYQRRVLMPVSGGQRDEMLNELLRDVAQELLVEQEQVDMEVVAWRQALGKYVSTRHQLQMLARNRTHWTEVKLDPMVKTQIEATFAADLAAAEGEGTPAAGPDEVVAVNADGNGGVVPVLPISRTLPSTTQPTTLYLGMFYVQATPNGLRVLLQRKGPLSMIPLVKLEKQHSVARRELEWLRETATRTAKGRSGGNGGDLTDRGREASVAPGGSRRNTAQSGLGSGGQPFPTVMSEAFLSFQADMNKSVGDLGKLLGSRVDLTPANLWTSSVLALSPEVHVVLFVHCTMSNQFPVDYSAIDCEFMPFTIFEIIHYSVYASRATQNWTRKYIANRLNARPGGQTVPGMTAVAKHADHLDGMDDHGLQSVFGSSLSMSHGGSQIGAPGGLGGNANDASNAFALTNYSGRPDRESKAIDQSADERARGKRYADDSADEADHRVRADSHNMDYHRSRDRNRQREREREHDRDRDHPELWEYPSPSQGGIPGHVGQTDSTIASPSNAATTPSYSARYHVSKNRRSTATSANGVQVDCTRPPRATNNRTTHNAAQGTAGSAAAAAAAAGQSRQNVTSAIVIVPPLPRALVQAHSSSPSNMRSPPHHSGASPGPDHANGVLATPASGTGITLMLQTPMADDRDATTIVEMQPLGGGSSNPSPRPADDVRVIVHSDYGDSEHDITAAHSGTDEADPDNAV